MLAFISVIIYQRNLINKSLFDSFKRIKVERRHPCEKVQKGTPNLPQHGVENLWMDISRWLLEHRSKHIVVLSRLYLFNLLSNENLIAPYLLFDGLHFPFLLVPEFDLVSVSKATNSNLYFLWRFMHNNNIVRTHVNMHDLILDEVVCCFDHLADDWSDLSLIKSP